MELKAFVEKHNHLTSAQIAEKLGKPELKMAIAGYKSGITKEKLKNKKAPLDLDKLFNIADQQPTVKPIKDKQPTVKKQSVKAVKTIYDGAEKIQARNHIVNSVNLAFKETPELHNGIIASLSAADPIIEKSILQFAPNTRFYCAERDREVYDQLVKNINLETLPITPFHCEIDELIYRKAINTYSSLILDYCGELGSFTQEIDFAVNNNIVKKGGVIAMTFSRKLRATKGKMYGVSLPRLNSDWTKNDKRSDSDRILEMFFTQLIGRYRNYELKELFTYNDSTSMVLVILKRIY